MTAGQRNTLPILKDVMMLGALCFLIASRLALDWPRRIASHMSQQPLADQTQARIGPPAMHFFFMSVAQC